MSQCDGVHGTRRLICGNVGGHGIADGPHHGQSCQREPVIPDLALQSDEAALVEELRAGSEEAFAWLITRYHQPIYSLLARTVRNSADAADLTQEVFVKVFRGIRGFHGDSSLRTWIYRIALREASNQRRWWIGINSGKLPWSRRWHGGRERQAGAIEGHARRSRRVAL